MYDKMEIEAKGHARPTHRHFLFYSLFFFRLDKCLTSSYFTCLSRRAAGTANCAATRTNHHSTFVAKRRVRVAARDRSELGASAVVSLSFPLSNFSSLGEEIEKGPARRGTRREAFYLCGEKELGEMAGFLNAAMDYGTQAVTKLSEVVSPQKARRAETTYDNASEDILHKINQDMESALQSKAGEKGEKGRGGRGRGCEGRHVTFTTKPGCG